MKVFVVGTAVGYARWIDNKTFVNNVEDADLVFFTGGSDVCPALYGCSKHDTTWDYPARDEYEKEVFEKMRPDQLAFGTCRGLRYCSSR